MVDIEFLELYKTSLYVGIIFSLVMFFFGDLLDGIFDAVVPGDTGSYVPLFVTFLSVFGGSGIIFTKYTFYEIKTVLIFSVAIGIAFSVAFYFFYLWPMKRSENSVGFSEKNLIGRSGELLASTSKIKCGEILIKIGAGYTNKIVMSLYDEEFPRGTIVTVRKVEEGILYVEKANVREETRWK